jgi:long-chain acyl-CoA synthetase
LVQKNPSMNIDEMIGNWACRQPDRMALHFHKNKKTYTYEKLEKNLAGLKKQLAAKGIIPGQIVALVLPDSEQLALFLIALLRMNTCVMPIDLSQDENKINELLAFAAPAHIISAIGDERISSIIGQVQVNKREELDGKHWLFTVTNPTMVHEDGATVLLPTSGTTGKPKIVQLSIKSMIHNARQVCHFLNIGPGDNFLSLTPLVFCHGFFNGILMPLINGCGTVVIDKFDAFVAARIWDIVKQHGVTVVNIVPTMLSMMMKIKYREADQSLPLRFMICGTAKLSAELRLGFYEKFNIPIYTQYGTTEALISTINATSGKHESVGRPITGCELIIRKQNGRRALVRETGELTVKGEFVTRGYFKNPELTAKVLRGNMLKTGDLGYYDEDGYVYICGRKNEMINKGGLKIFPEDIDRIFRLHPAIGEVYTVGIHDDEYGEDIYTFAVPKKNARLSIPMLFEFARSKLSKEKIPREIILLDRIPKGQTGKYLIRDLRNIILLKRKI